MGGRSDLWVRRSLAGLALRVAAPDPAVGALAAERFRWLPPSTGVEEAAIDVVVVRGPGARRELPSRPSGTGRTVYDAPTAPVEYFEEPDRVFLELPDRVRCLVAPADGRVDIAVVGTDEADAVVAVHPVLTLALMEAAKRQGRFSLHAAAVDVDGVGVLVAGPSGAGKSTLTVGLVRAGARFLADDTVLLVRDTERGLAVHGIPDDVDVTDRTIALVPELDEVGRRPVAVGREKRSFGVEDVFGGHPASSCRPSVLLLPEVTPGAGPRLEPVGAAEALAALAPNVLLTQPRATQAHLDVLGDLVAGIRRFRFSYGEDLAAAAACVADLAAG